MGAVIGVPVGVVFVIQLFIMCACLSVVLVTFGLGLDYLDVYLVGKELVILPFECVVGKMFCYVFSGAPGVYVGTLNLIASIPCPSILTLAGEFR